MRLLSLHAVEQQQDYDGTVLSNELLKRTSGRYSEEQLTSAVTGTGWIEPKLAVSLDELFRDSSSGMYGESSGIVYGAHGDTFHWAAQNDSLVALRSAVDTVQTSSSSSSSSSSDEHDKGRQDGIDASHGSVREDSNSDAVRGGKGAAHFPRDAAGPGLVLVPPPEVSHGAAKVQGLCITSSQSPPRTARPSYANDRSTSPNRQEEVDAAPSRRISDLVKNAADTLMRLHGEGRSRSQEA